MKNEVKGFAYVETTEEEKERLWKAVRAHGYGMNDYQNAKVDKALVNEDRSILFTRADFVCDGIKHCGEPDDYIYVIVRGEEHQGALVWYEKEPRVVRQGGDKILENKQIVELAKFYQKEVYRK